MSSLKRKDFVVWLEDNEDELVGTSQISSHCPIANYWRRTHDNVVANYRWGVYIKLST